MYEIEKNVPMPNGRHGRGPKYPWKDMKVGDSFFVSGTTTANISRSANIQLGAGCYRTTKEGDGVRVWRIK